MAVLSFHKMPPLTSRDRVIYPWLIAYRGGARRPLWQPTGGGRYRVIVPKWVIPKDTGTGEVPKESKDDPGLQPTSEDPDA